MFEWIVNYIEPIIMIVVAWLFLRVWSTVQLRKAQIEEEGKLSRSQVNVDGKVATSRYELMQDVRNAAGIESEDDEMGQMMAMMSMLNPQKNEGEVAVINELQEFAKTEDGAQAMAKFSEWQNNKGGS